MEEKMLKDYNVKEFFEFFDKKRLEIKLIISNVEKKKKMFDICCGVEKVHNPINNTIEPYFYCYKDKIQKTIEFKNGKEEMILLFKNIFGYKFFDFTIDEMRNLEEKGMFTRNGLKKIFEDVIGIKDGKVINLPKSWEELIDLLGFIIKKIDDKTTSEQDRNGYLHSLVTIENLVAANYKDLMSLLYAEEQLLKNVNEVCEKYKSKKIITVENIDEVRELLNHGMMEEQKGENGNKHYREVGFGDLTIRFIELYNDEINRVNNLKNREVEINRAFKKLKSKSLDKLEYSDFPNLPMEKELYLGLKSKIYKYVCSKNNDKKDLTHLVPLLDMYYYGYTYSDHDLKKKQSDLFI